MSILDYVKPTLAPNVWEEDDKGVTLRSEIEKQILDTLESAFKKLGSGMDDFVASIYIIGGITSRQWTDESDIDVTVVVRKDMSDKAYGALREYVVNNLNGNMAADTQHPVNYYFKKEHKFVPDVAQAIYDIKERRWLYKDERGEEFDPEAKYQDKLVAAEEMAEDVVSLVEALKRDLIDLGELKQAKKDSVFYSVVYSEKLGEVWADVENLERIYAQIHLEREKAFAEDPKGANESTANIIYKYLEKYGYLDELKDVLAGQDKFLKGLSGVVGLDLKEVLEPKPRIDEGYNFDAGYPYTQLKREVKAKGRGDLYAIIDEVVSQFYPHDKRKDGDCLPINSTVFSALEELGVTDLAIVEGGVWLKKPQYDPVTKRTRDDFFHFLIVNRFSGKLADDWAFDVFGGKIKKYDVNTVNRTQPQKVNKKMKQEIVGAVKGVLTETWDNRGWRGVLAEEPPLGSGAVRPLPTWEQIKTEKKWREFFQSIVFNNGVADLYPGYGLDIKDRKGKMYDSEADAKEMIMLYFDSLRSLPEPIPVWRILYIPSGNPKDIKKSQGVSWAYTEEGARQFKAGFVRNANFLLSGVTPSSNVDWEQTFWLNFIEGYADELRVKDPAKVRGVETEKLERMTEGMKFLGLAKAMGLDEAQGDASSAIKTEAFKKWFGKSKVVDSKGNPLVVYRGEHGKPGKTSFQTRLGSYSFGSAETAELYSTEPNVRGEKPQSPRVIPVYLKIEKPLVDTDDPFIGLDVIEKELGTTEALRIAKKFSDSIENTGNWMDEINPKGSYSSVEEFLKENPGRVGELYFEAFNYFDDPLETAKLTAKGFDGAITSGSGENEQELEYRIFNPKHAMSAITGKLMEELVDPNSSDINEGDFQDSGIIQKADVREKIYHVSTAVNRGKILKQGLIPRKGYRQAHNQFETVPAIYFYNLPLDSVLRDWMHTSNFDLWEIDTKGLKNKFYYDGNYDEAFALLTYDSIPAKNIKLIYKSGQIVEHLVEAAGPKVTSFDLSDAQIKELAVKFGQGFNGPDDAEQYLRDLLTNKFPFGYKDIPNQFKLYRVVWAKSAAKVNKKKVGTHYIMNAEDIENIVEKLWAEHSSDETPFVLTVKASREDIDIPETIYNNLLYPYEYELTLKEKAMPEVVKVTPSSITEAKEDGYYVFHHLKGMGYLTHDPRVPGDIDHPSTPNPKLALKYSKEQVDAIFNECPHLKNSTMTDFITEAKDEPKGLLRIAKSKNADTRSCDYANVSIEELEKSSKQHIADVVLAMEYFAKLLQDAAKEHDADKLTGIKHFHSDFIGGFKETGWLENHYKEVRHHLSRKSGRVPEDVNFIDVLEYIADNVMAGMGRSGEVRKMDITPEDLQLAFDNTVKMLTGQVVVSDTLPELKEEDVKDKLRETLADYAHKAWAGWIKYQFGKCTRNEDGSLVVPAESVARWERQVDTPYEELPEKEQVSDRAEADKMIALFKRHKTASMTEAGEPQGGVTPEMKSFFESRTRRHISLVQKYCKLIASTDLVKYGKLIGRGQVHDQSKLKEPELTPYIHVTWHYKMKDAGKEYKVPDELANKMNDATLHHVQNNPHHPEYYSGSRDDINRNDRDKPPTVAIDATKMSDLDIAEMVADWLALSEEKGTKAKTWADKNIGARWKFTPEQTELIYKLIALAG